MAVELTRLNLMLLEVVISWLGCGLDTQVQCTPVSVIGATRSVVSSGKVSRAHYLG
jgi:hypothetical protein